MRRSAGRFEISMWRQLFELIQCGGFFFIVVGDLGIQKKFKKYFTREFCEGRAREGEGQGRGEGGDSNKTLICNFNIRTLQ